MDEETRAFHNDLARRACTDEAAFTELYTIYIEQIFPFVMKRVGHRETCEDIVSDVFRKVFLHLRAFNPKKSSFRTWIFRIATNTVIDHYRVNRNERKPSFVDRDELALYPSDDDSPHDLVLAEDQKASIRSCLTQLPKRDEEVLTLRYIQDLSNQEIADILEISPNHVGVLLHRALKKMKGILEPTTSTL